MSTHLEHVDDASFDTAVLASPEPYLLDFSAVWCPPCRALEPILESIAAEHRGKLRIGKIDIDTSPLVAARYGVRGAPTLVLFKNGQEAGRRLGLANKRALLQLVGL